MERVKKDHIKRLIIVTSDNISGSVKHLIALCGSFLNELSHFYIHLVKKIRKRGPTLDLCFLSSL